MTSSTSGSSECRYKRPGTSSAAPAVNTTAFFTDMGDMPRLANIEAAIQNSKARIAQLQADGQPRDLGEEGRLTRLVRLEHVMYKALLVFQEWDSDEEF